MNEEDTTKADATERQAVIFQQLDKLTSRARILNAAWLSSI